MEWVNIRFEEIEEILVKFLRESLLKALHRSGVDSEHFFIKIEREKEGDLITLYILLCTVKFLVVFKEIDIKLQTAFHVSLVDNIKDPVK